MWFEAVNRYSVVDSDFLHLLDQYTAAESEEAFCESLTITGAIDVETAQGLLTNLQTYLQTVHSPFQDTETAVTPDYQPNHPFKINYEAYGKGFTIEADRPILVEVIAGSWQHLAVTTTFNKPVALFTISEDQTHLHLYLDRQPAGSYLKTEYHRLQGRLAMLLLGALHDVPDADWLAAFHASTVAKNGSALMLAGASGKGKSTLSALLTGRGFSLVADDLTAMDTQQRVYCYPAAVSVKPGAVAALKAVFPQLGHLPITQDYKKGGVIYLPLSPSKAPSLPCSHLLLVHYHEQPVKARLTAIDRAKALEVLIPDTWLSPRKAHAKNFLKWVQALNTYELHYHDDQEAAELLNQLVKS